MKFFGGKKQAEPPRRRAAAMRLEEESTKFRRSATLTGSLSDDIKASAEERGHLQSDRVELQAKRQRQRRRSRRLMAVGMILAAMCLLYLNHISSFTIDFAANPAKRPSTTPYVATAKEFAHSGLASQFTPSMNGRELAAYIMARHKEVASVQVSRGLFDKSPHLKLTLRKPVLMWQTKRDPNAFYVDASGTSFAFNGYGTDQSLVRIDDESGVPAELGVPVVSSRQISFLGQLVGQVAQSSKDTVVITRIVFPSTSTKEIDVYLKDRKFFAKVYLERSARAQAEEIVNGLAYFESKKIAPADYIDVRVAERIYYK